MEERLEVNVFHFTAVIAACDRKNWQLSLLLLEEMVKLQIAPNQISYSSAATSCASAGYWHLSLDLLYAMPLKRLTPDQVSFNAAIDAYRGVSWECAVDLLLEMPRRRLLQDAVSFGAAISACERDSEWQAVLELLSLMYKMKVQLNEISGSAAISACGQKGGQWEISLALLRDMLQAAGRPDRLVWNAAITACETSSQWILALALLKDMSYTTQPDVVTYTACLSALQRRRFLWQQALQFLSQMEEAQNLPNVITLSAAATACTQGGQPLQLRQLLLRVSHLAWALMI